MVIIPVIIPVIVMVIIPVIIPVIVMVIIPVIIIMPIIIIIPVNIQHCPGYRVQFHFMSNSLDYYLYFINPVIQFVFLEFQAVFL